MSTVYKTLITKLIVIFLLLPCLAKSEENKKSEYDLNLLAASLKTLNSNIQANIVVLGTHHFSSDVLSNNNQQNIERIVEQLQLYQPTKIFVEWQPSKQPEVDLAFQKYLKNELFIKSLPNEVYQLGFRLAKRLKHNKIYMFDDQTPFIGSLTNFSFESFQTYAKKHDNGFYNRLEPTIISHFEQNQIILKSVPLFEEFALRNSPQAQKINAERMHAYENRVGIQQNWIGADWLGRWYQRNVRMSSNVLKATQNNDKILIIVGDNHKWVLDFLFEQMPEFTVKSSWKLLNQ